MKDSCRAEAAAESRLDSGRRLQCRRRRRRTCSGELCASRSKSRSRGRSPSQSPEPASSRILRALIRSTKSWRARCTALEYVLSPLKRTASSRSLSSSTRFVRFMCITYPRLGPAVNRNIRNIKALDPEAPKRPQIVWIDLSNSIWHNHGGNDPEWLATAPSAVVS